MTSIERRCLKCRRPHWGLDEVCGECLRRIDKILSEDLSPFITDYPSTCDVCYQKSTVFSHNGTTCLNCDAAIRHDQALGAVEPMVNLPGPPQYGTAINISAPVVPNSSCCHIKMIVSTDWNTAILECTICGERSQGELGAF